MVGYSNPFAGMFFANEPGGATAQDMRRKIALAMLMKRSTAPKNLGEGLYSIGDSIGDALIARSTVNRTGEEAAKDTATIDTMAAPPAPTLGPRAEVDEPAVAPAQTAAVAPTVPGAPQPPAAASPPGGFRPPPAYLAPALDRLVQDPARRAYLGHLAGKEARSATEVSPTGAAGPFQFIRSTGRQYGLVGPDGDRRTDVDASIDAVNRLTDDNAAALTKALGREPTPGELALAHQQGAGTAAKMLTGAGNASNYNLAVNNAGGLGPQAAAQKIMGYYGMPGSGGPRDRAAAILAARPPGPTDQAQEATFSDVMGSRAPAPLFAPTASAGRVGDIQSDLPPVTGALSGPMGQAVGDTVQQRQDALVPPGGPAPPPPGPQVAQAPPSVFPPVATDAGGPKAIIPGGGLPPGPQIPAAPPDPRSEIRSAPEYKPRDEPMPEPPTKPTMGPIEQQLTRQYLNADVSPRVKEAAQRHIEAERAQRNAVYENQFRNYEIRKSDWLKQRELETKYRMELPKQQQDILQSQATTDKTRAGLGKEQAESEIAQINAGFYRRVGRDREPFLKEFATDKEQVAKSASLLRNVQTAREALNTGAVASGFGANSKFNLAQIGAAIGSNDAKQIAEQTEKYKQAMDSSLSYGVMLVNGKDPRVTDADLKQAAGITGTPDMQLASKRRILDAMSEDLHGRVKSYEDKREEYLRGDPQHRMFKVDTPPTAPPAVTDVLLKNRDNENARAIYDRDYGKGAAALEIARAKRREQRNREDD